MKALHELDQGSTSPEEWSILKFVETATLSDGTIPEGTDPTCLPGLPDRDRLECILKLVRLQTFINRVALTILPIPSTTAIFRGGWTTSRPEDNVPGA